MRTLLHLLNEVAWMASAAMGHDLDDLRAVSVYTVGSHHPLGPNRQLVILRGHITVLAALVLTDDGVLILEA